MSRHLVGAESGRTDLVTAVIIPMDGATRIPIRTGIKVQLWDADRDQASPTQLVRNLSGQWVLLNASKDQDFTFRIVPDGVPYRGPVFTTFNPKREGRPDRIVALERRADAAFDDVATLLRGIVVRRDQAGTGKAVPQEGVRISASGSDLTGHQFPATSDDRGSFALIVNIRRPAPDETPTVQTRLRFERDGLLTRALDVALTHGRTHVFSTPVDLDETGTVRFQHEPLQP
jgi:hypothetical protein